VIAFLNQRHSADFCFITWVLLSQFLQIDMVDHEDKIHVAGEQFSEQTTRPLFKGFWQHGMVSVGESVVDYVPSLLIG
jgi:hypothetical protein